MSYIYKRKHTNETLDMDTHIIYIAGALLISMVCGLIAIPLIISFCYKHNIYDLPTARKVHKKGIPRLGGVCVLPSMLAAILAVVPMLNSHSETGNEVTISLWSCMFFLSLTLIYSTGLTDDLVGLGPKTKLGVQILAASFLPLSGLYINNLYGLFGIHEIPYWIGFGLTVFMIVFIDNAMNLIDGIDGLCGGVALISLSGFLYCFMRSDMLVYSMLIAAMMGVLCSFLYFNVFGTVENKRKIFMGDSGSLTIGFILGFLWVKFCMDTPKEMPFRTDSVVISFSLIIVPLLDVVRVSLVRLLHGRPVFSADKNHIHHKMLRTGMTQHQALLAILAMCVAFIVINMLLTAVVSSTIIAITDILLWMAIQQVINIFIRRRGEVIFNPTEQ